MPTTTPKDALERDAASIAEHDRLCGEVVQAVVGCMEKLNE